MIIRRWTNESRAKKQEKDSATIFSFKHLPSARQAFSCILFNMNNLKKPGRVKKSHTWHRYQVEITEPFIPDQRKLSIYMDVCGFQKKLTPNGVELPIPFLFAAPLPLVAPIVSHKKFPCKPAFSGLIHMGQTIRMLQPIPSQAQIRIAADIFEGKHTDRGFELQAKVCIYLAQQKKEDEVLVADGISSFLLSAKRGVKKGDEKQSDTVANPTKTTEFSFAKNAGRKYAPGTGDYNPIHLHPLGAKLLAGYKRGAIAHGFYSISKCVASLGDRTPAYPVVVTATLDKPCYLPSKVVMLERQTSTAAVDFELWSADRKFRHLVASMKHEPGLTL